MYIKVIGNQCWGHGRCQGGKCHNEIRVIVMHFTILPSYIRIRAIVMCVIMVFHSSCMYSIIWSGLVYAVFLVVY